MRRTERFIIARPYSRYAEMDVHCCTLPEDLCGPSNKRKTLSAAP